MAFFQSGHVALKHVRVSSMVNLICMVNVHPVQIYAVLQAMMLKGWKCVFQKCRSFNFKLCINEIWYINTCYMVK